MPAGTVSGEVRKANRSSQAVGFYWTGAGASFAALWDDGDLVTLDQFRPAGPDWDGWRLYEASGISENGWIIGLAQTPPPYNVRWRQWLLRPGAKRLTVTVQPGDDPGDAEPDQVVVEARAGDLVQRRVVQAGTSILDLHPDEWELSIVGATGCVVGPAACKATATVDLQADDSLTFEITGPLQTPPPPPPETPVEPQGPPATPAAALPVVPGVIAPEDLVVPAATPLVPHAARFGRGPARIALRNGAVGIPLTCPKTATQACRGTLSVAARARLRAVGSGPVLGTVAVRVLPGRGVTVRVPISRAGRRAIQRGPLPATARLVGTTGAQTVRVARAVTLVAPPARPR